MSKCDIRSQFECQNSILHDKMRYSAQIERQNSISNDKMRYLSCIRKSKQDLECQNEMFGPNSNVIIRIAIFGPIQMTK